MLRDHDFLFVQHRGEQRDLPVRDAAQPFPVDRDRGQQVDPGRPASARARSQPPIRSSRASAPMAWTRVRIRFSLGAMILRRSGRGSADISDRCKRGLTRP